MKRRRVEPWTARPFFLKQHDQKKQNDRKQSFWFSKKRCRSWVSFFETRTCGGGGDDDWMKTTTTWGDDDDVVFLAAGVWPRLIPAYETNQRKPWDHGWPCQNLASIVRGWACLPKEWKATGTNLDCPTTIVSGDAVRCWSRQCGRVLRCHHTPPASMCDYPRVSLQYSRGKTKTREAPSCFPVLFFVLLLAKKKYVHYVFVFLQQLLQQQQQQLCV